MVCTHLIEIEQGGSFEKKIDLLHSDNESRGLIEKSSDLKTPVIEFCL